MKRKIVVIVILLAIIKISSFTIISGYFYIELDKNFNPDKSNLINAPEQITINNHDFKLECSIWRDFMPCIGDGCGNHEAICSVKIIDLNLSTFPEDIDAIQFWAINQNDIWYASIFDPAFSNDQYILYENELRFVVRNGPNTENWARNTLVDIVVQLRYNSQLYLLKISDQPILFTY